MEKVLTARIDGRQMEDDFEIIDAILESRGIDDLESFLKPAEDDLVPFENMKNIDKAYQIIDDGITMGERFLILADVDTDGVSAGAIMTRYLIKAGADVDVTINDGKAHGLETFDMSMLENYDIF
jgi:single-stranded DNA-specific DHH superfamily exonuclease